MDEIHSEDDVLQLLHTTTGLGVGYWAIMIILDQIFYHRALFPMAYYILGGLVAFALLGMAHWPWIQVRLGRIFLPLMIITMTVLPITLQQIMATQLPPGPQTRPEYAGLRLTPILLMPLVLTAWRYRWRYVVLFNVGVATFSLGLHGLSFWFRGAPFLPPLTIVTVQLISFLIVGYFISALMCRLREQRHALEVAHQQVVHYASALEHLTVSRERNRMARELHDTLAHTLSAMSVQLETVKAYWDVEPDTAKALLDRALAANRSGLQETRRALKSLRAAPLDDLGLLLALRKLAEETAERANTRLDMALPDRLPALSPGVEQCVYRVAQESLSNAAHHASARTLVLRLTIEGARLSLSVHDDGVGFDPGAPQPEGHFGLPGMRERARLAGGRLTIESAPEVGTAVHLTIDV